MPLQPQIYKIKVLGSGFLAAMAKPAPGEYIEQEFSGIVEAGINAIVSLLEPSEARELGLGDERQLAEKNGMRFISFPIVDMNLPASLQSFHELTAALYQQVLSGTNTVIHCRAGIGRTGMVTAGVLLHSGMTPQAAFELISEKRGVSVPDTGAQRDWVVANSRSIVTGVVK
jgi:protein-tyrosine phosphatase